MNCIIDTGPWVALIDRSETRHDACVQWFKGFRGKLYSTEAVLTEVLYLLNFSIKAQVAALEFVLTSVVEIVPSSINSLKEAKAFILKYADLPMDFADATLVCLAIDTGIKDIVTLDQKDFSIYKIKKQSFNIYP